MSGMVPVSTRSQSRCSSRSTRRISHSSRNQESAASTGLGKDLLSATERPSETFRHKSGSFEKQRFFADGDAPRAVCASCRAQEASGEVAEDRGGGCGLPWERCLLGGCGLWPRRILKMKFHALGGACFPDGACGSAVGARQLRVVEAARNRKRPFRARCAASRSADAFTTRRFASGTDTPRTGRKGRGRASRSQDEEFGANPVARVKNRDVHREWFAVCA